MRPEEMLALAIEQAYVVFARYPRPTAWEAAPTRDGAAILAGLTSAPLRELTAEQIGGYAGWAITTVGGVDHYRHFLPRILELSARGAAGQIGLAPPSLAQKLNHAGWRSWPNDEYVAISTLFAAAWPIHRETGSHHEAAADWLCAIALLGGDVRPLLSGWLSADPSTHALVQAGWLVMSADSFLGPQSEADYWAEADPDSFGQVLAWMFSPPVKSALEAGLDQVDDEDRWILERALAAVGRSRH